MMLQTKLKFRPTRDIHYIIQLMMGVCLNEFYSAMKWEVYSCIRPSYVRPSIYIPQILWHQLLLNYQVDFFKTCTDDLAGCVDDRKERIFSSDLFY
jgi:hypothetical protein